MHKIFNCDSNLFFFFGQQSHVSRFAYDDDSSIVRPRAAEAEADTQTYTERVSDQANANVNKERFYRMHLSPKEK